MYIPTRVSTWDVSAHGAESDKDEEDIANVKLSHVTQTLIVEAVNNLQTARDMLLLALTRGEALRQLCGSAA